MLLVIVSGIIALASIFPGVAQRILVNNGARRYIQGTGMGSVSRIFAKALSLILNRCISSGLSKSNIKWFWPRLTEQPPPIRPRVEVFFVAWNDVHLLPYTVRFYRERLGLAGLRITVFDNESDDGTPELARALGCRVISYSTGGHLDDRTNMDLKNNCFKTSEADWIIIVDLDEWVDVRPIDLDLYEAAGVTIVKTEGVTLVWESDTLDLNELPMTVQGDIDLTSKYSKPCLFDKRSITEFNSGPGGHVASPEGHVKWLADATPPILPPRLYHAKYFNETYLLERTMASNKRLSEENKSNGWGQQYFDSAMGSVSKRIRDIRQAAEPLHELNGTSIFVPGEGGSPI